MLTLRLIIKRQMTTILENIVQSPKLKDHFEWLRNYIKEEQQKRKDFYDFVTEDIKLNLLMEK